MKATLHKCDKCPHRAFCESVLWTRIPLACERSLVVEGETFRSHNRWEPRARPGPGVKRGKLRLRMPVEGR